MTENAEKINREGEEMKRFFMMLCAVVVICSFGVHPALSAEKVLKLGASVCITGRLAKEGNLVKDGYTLWLEEVNKRGGIKVGNDNYKVEIIFYDDRSDPQTGAKLTEKLITEDKVRFILGPYGSVITMATVGISEKYKVLTLAPMSNANFIFERGLKYFISVLPRASLVMRPIVDFSQHLTPKPKNVAIIHADDAFPEFIAAGVKDYCVEKGLQVLLFGKYPKDVKDVSSILFEVKNKAPEMLLCGSYFNDGLLISKQMKESNFAAKLVAMSVGPEIPAYVENLGKDAEGVIGYQMWVPTAPWKDPFYGTSANYAEMMKKRFGYIPSYHATAASVAGELLQLSIEKAGTLDIPKVTETLRNIKVQTIWGPMAWNEKGENTEIHASVIQVINGKVEVIYPFEGKTANAIYPFVPWGQRK
jgi:branched-chain amino acid transport system substrate-binding protein